MKRRWQWLVPALAAALLAAASAEAALVVRDLGTLGGSSSGARGINATGQVVGFSQITGDTAVHAFLYSGGVMTDLGTLGGRSSIAYAINASGQVVGNSSLPDDPAVHAFLYSGGVMTDLNSRIEPGSGWTIIEARAINDRGQIAASGRSARGELHALLLEPQEVAGVPEPSTLGMAGTALALVGLAAGRRGLWSRPPDPRSRPRRSPPRPGGRDLSGRPA